jgi:hypothetical protein
MNIEINILTYDSIEIKKTINLLKKKIKYDNNKNITGTILPKILQEQNFIILIKNKNLDEILSFIWYGFYDNERFGRILHINFSYTFNKFKNNGFNTFLRLQLEKICIKNKIKYITSLPFENSPSKKILIKLSYKSELNYFYKKIV